MLPVALGVTKSPATADEVAACLQMLDHADGDAQLRTKLTADARGPVTVDWHWQTAVHPTWAVCYHDEWTLILVGGCQTYEHAARTVAGYLAPRAALALSERTTNAYFDDVGSAILLAVHGQPRLMNQPLTLAGHSLGGCVAQTVAAYLRQAQQITNNATICTFGSPKWAWRWQQTEIGHVPQARWMNSDDPVPLVYPTINDYLPFLLQYTAVQALGVSRFTQAAGGLVIAPNGDIHGADYPPLTAVEWQVAMAGWLWNREDGGPTNPHSLTQYRARLQAWLARDLPPANLPRPAEGIAPIEEHNRRIVNQAEVRVQRQVAAVEAAQRDVPERIPRERLVRVEHRGRVHVIVWNDQTIAVVVRRRTAHALARNCNDFLHALLHAGLVEPDSIVAQLQQFLGQAGQAGSGISPQLTPFPNGD